MGEKTKTKLKKVCSDGKERTLYKDADKKDEFFIKKKGSDGKLRFCKFKPLEKAKAKTPAKKKCKRATKKKVGGGWL